MKLSVVFPHINEPDEANATIQSIRATAGNSVEIVVVDDCSSTRPDIVFADKVIFNPHRCGTGPSRHIGAEAATGTHILICDCHMRFVMGWYSEFIKAAFTQHSDGSIGHMDTTSVYCAACIQLDEEHMDINHPTGVYHGATFNFYGPDKVNPKNPNQVLEGNWLEKRPEAIYEIPCCMGACYFMSRARYLELSPHRYLRTWGCEEQMLSLKTWLSGGKVYQVNSIKIGHKFRRNLKKLPFDLRVKDIIWNKLFCIYTCLPEPYATGLMKKFPRDMNFNLAYQSLRENWHVVATEQARNANLFNTSFQSLLERWRLECPRHGS